MASIISLHYNPLEYAQPEEFRPQRHLAEGSLTMPESYKPYGVGEFIAAASIRLAFVKHKEIEESWYLKLHLPITLYTYFFA